MICGEMCRIDFTAQIEPPFELCSLCYFLWKHKHSLMASCQMSSCLNWSYCSPGLIIITLIQCVVEQYCKLTVFLHRAACELVSVKAYFMTAHSATLCGPKRNKWAALSERCENTDSLALRKLNRWHPHCAGNALLVQSNCHCNNCLEKI